MVGIVIDPRRVRDLSPDALDDTGRIRVLPATFWADTTMEERGLFGHRTGIYGFPTQELVDHLLGIVGERSAIEIGAGHGVLAEALGIPATDSRQHEMPKYREYYARKNLPIAPYGPNIVKMNASRAVRRYQPEVVIGCWVTWKYDPKRHEARGNERGIDELDVLGHCETYVMIGNEETHAGSRLWERPHQVEYLPFVYSRASNGAREFVAVWPGGHAAEGVPPPVR